MTFADDVGEVLDELKTMLIQKNEGYGNSALSPVRIFSKADNIEQIRVRIDDKLSRILHGNCSRQEDTIWDLMGYLVLLRIAQRQHEQPEVEDTGADGFEPEKKLCGCGDELSTAEGEKQGKCGICQSVEPALNIPEKLKGLGGWERGDMRPSFYVCGGGSAVNCH